MQDIFAERETSLSKGPHESLKMLLLLIPRGLRSHPGARDTCHSDTSQDDNQHGKEKLSLNRSSHRQDLEAKNSCLFRNRKIRQGEWETLNLSDGDPGSILVCFVSETKRSTVISGWAIQ